jgi:hypothetical protein
MSFRRRNKTNLGFNSANRRLENFNAVAAASYVPPLPVYPVGYVTETPPPPPPTGTAGIGTTGNWNFEELSEADGVSLLNLLYKTRQVHTFLST